MLGDGGPPPRGKVRTNRSGIGLQCFAGVVMRNGCIQLTYLVDVIDDLSDLVLAAWAGTTELVISDPRQHGDDGVTDWFQIDHAHLRVRRNESVMVQRVAASELIGPRELPPHPGVAVSVNS
jgi:hypothetical protein